MQFDEVLEKNGVLKDSHIEELCDTFETLFSKYFNKKKEAQCKCTCPYCHYITTEVKETEAEFQPLNKLLQALEISENLDGGINRERVKLTMLVDCGPPSTIIGVENFKQIKK